MKVFIGWFGETSKKIASILKSWLPMINPRIETFASFDIQLGADWENSLLAMMASADCALFCITPDCARSPWLTYEIGVLMGSGAKRLFPILCGTSASSLPTPALMFQTARFDRDDILNVTLELNRLCGKDALPEKELYRLFDGLYPWLEENVQSLLRDLPAPEEEPDASNANLKLEMRALNRKLDTLLSRLPESS